MRASGQREFQSSAPAPPLQPLLQGALRSVSSADVARILQVTRRFMMKEYGSALPIYVIAVSDPNHVNVGYWVRDQYLRKDVERVRAKWKVTDAEPERIITTGANIPTS
jgi:hypothetical protein